MARNKRPRQLVGETMELVESSHMARFLMLFSGHGAPGGGVAASPERVFECKTCSRQFPSFQALGGHRASHKKPRLGAGGEGEGGEPARPKVHECSVCGLEFAVGQALGGHMRRHRAVMADSLGLGLGLGYAGLPGIAGGHGKKAAAAGLVLDLNVPPLEEEMDCTKLGLTIELPIAVDFPRLPTEKFEKKAIFCSIFAPNSSSGI